MSEWPTIPFRETGKWLSGGTPTRDEPSYWGGDVPWIGTKDLKGFDLIGSSEFITDLGADAGSRVVAPGAVLFVTRGMSLAKEFRVAVAATRLAFNQDVKAIVPRADLDGRFLAWFLRSKEQYVLDQCDTATHGTKRLPLERIDGMPVPLPPLAVQHRIAAILDEADALRRKRREALGLLGDLLRSVFLEMFGDPVTNPRGWPNRSLSSLCRLVTDGTHQSPEWSVTGVPFLFVSNVVDGELDFNVAKHISEDSWRTLTARAPIELDDILYTTVGSYGNSALVRTTRPFAFQRHIAHIKPDAGRIHPEYLLGFLQSPAAKRMADDQARGVAQKTLNLRELKEFRVPVPSASSQSDYVEVRRSIEAGVVRARAACREHDALFASLLQRAFTGKL